MNFKQLILKLNYIFGAIVFELLVVTYFLFLLKIFA